MKSKLLASLVFLISIVSYSEPIVDISEGKISVHKLSSKLKGGDTTVNVYIEGPAAAALAKFIEKSSKVTPPVAVNGIEIRGTTIEGQQIYCTRNDYEDGPQYFCAIHVNRDGTIGAGATNDEPRGGASVHN
jgi:hypothetical protein